MGLFSEGNLLKKVSKMNYNHPAIAAGLENATYIHPLPFLLFILCSSYYPLVILKV